MKRILITTALLASLSLGGRAHRAAYDNPERYAASAVSTEFTTTSVNTDFTTTSVKKEVYRRGREDDETVYHTLIFDVDWPAQPRDPRLNIQPLQRSLVEVLEKYVIATVYDNGDDAPALPSTGRCRTLNDVQTLFFSSKKGTDLRSIPSSVDYRCQRNDELYFSIEDVSGIKGCITCLVHYEFYGGGAHGDRVISHVVLDVETGAMKHLSDLFTPQQRQKMLQIIRTRPLDEEGHRADIDDFFELDELEELPDNFYIDNGIIYFQFQTYEIGPYCIGAPVLGVRLSEVQ